MKKFTVFFLSMFLMMLGISNQASAAGIEPKDLAGKWEIKMVGLPDGDTTMIAEFSMDGDKVVGKAKSDGMDVNFDEITIKDQNVTLYFNAAGYDVSMYVTFSDNNNAKGDLMNMFDVVWKRVIEE